MAEAFVAVADDATSIYWNPAGMATGAFLSLVLDYGTGSFEPGADRAANNHFGFVGFTVPPLGIGYYRQSMGVAGPAAPEGMAGPSREEGRRSVQRLTTANIGVNLAQSLSDYVVVASTVKVVRGEVASGVVTGGRAEDALDAAGLATRRTTRLDVDAGAMVAVERWRAGLVARNLTTPEFERPEPGMAPVELGRAVRAGVAWGSGWPGMTRLVVSGDVDLTSQPSRTGDRRDVAAGVESWWLGQRLGLRGGVRGSTEGAARPVVAGGVSAAIRPGVFVEAHVSRGRDDEQSWGVGGRVTF